MRIHLVAAGTRMPAWVTQGFQDYARRLPHECSLSLVEIPLAARGRNSNPEQLRAEEGRRMLAALPRDALVIALDVKGQTWSTGQLADRLQQWLPSGRDVALLVGGPDGLSQDCLQRAEYSWSLSPLTFPHALVRVLVAEQIYRAWTITRGHPYHRS